MVTGSKAERLASRTSRARGVAIMCVLFTGTAAIVVPPSFPRPGLAPVERSLALSTLPLLVGAWLVALVAAALSPEVHLLKVRGLVFGALTLLNCGALLSSRDGVHGTGVGITIVPSLILVSLMYGHWWKGMASPA